jgi:hypothetical protein
VFRNFINKKYKNPKKPQHNKTNPPKKQSKTASDRLAEARGFSASVPTTQLLARPPPPKPKPPPRR